jgi:hypothetical protein
MVLVAWGAAWMLGLKFLDRPRRSAKRPVVAVTGGVMVLLALVVGVIWLSLDAPPNVPHRPDPNQPQVEALAVDRATCLACHQFGTAGAPVIPHEIQRSCDEGPCWGGRADCAGCHRIDPDLGGPALLVQVDPIAAPIETLPSVTREMTTADIDLVEDLVTRR